MEKDKIHKHLGKILCITLNDGQVHIGQLGYTPASCSRLGFTIPDSYYIGDSSFKAEEVKKLKVVWG